MGSTRSPVVKMRFYVGLHHPNDSWHFDNAFVSFNALRERVSNFLCNRWIMDSGAFSEISEYGGFRSAPEDYAKAVDQWKTCGGFECAVSQDFMCEPHILKITGMTVRDHQRLTIERYDALRAATDAPVMPVLQGYQLHEYLEHREQYGDRITDGMRVGIGSVCKRNANIAIIEQIVLGIKDAFPRLRFHGFGVKTTALSSSWVWDALYSADSMAWSRAARLQGRNANSWREAKDFENRILSQHRSRKPLQPALI